jgi:hypothetical protein
MPVGAISLFFFNFGAFAIRSSKVRQCELWPYYYVVLVVVILQIEIKYKIVRDKHQNARPWCCQPRFCPGVRRTTGIGPLEADFAAAAGSTAGAVGLCATRFRVT